MVVTITISLAGAGTGPFDLYSNSDGFSVPFAIGVSKATLEAGYTTNLVPNDATLIKVMSTGTCTDYVTVSIAMANGTTTTTTTSIIGTTSTTTTNPGELTTTSTTTAYAAACLTVQLSDVTNELACDGPNPVYDVYRTYKATLLNGPGGTPIPAPVNITVSIPTSGDFGTYNLDITINAGDTFGEAGLYTRVYEDCSDRNLIKTQIVNLNGLTISPNTYARCV
jgi:hypothetical protein